jgi:hypothetical protein
MATCYSRARLFFVYHYLVFKDQVSADEGRLKKNDIFKLDKELNYSFLACLVNHFLTQSLKIFIKLLESVTAISIIH